MSAALEWAAVLSGPAGLGVGAWGKGIFDRKVRKSTGTKIDAEAVKTFTEAAVTLVAPLKEEIVSLKLKVDAYVDYIQDLHMWIAEHTDEIPPPPPIVMEA
jgi:hypothetical protein